MDGWFSRTQLLSSNSSSRVDFELTHLIGQAAVILHSKAYFIGGYPLTNAVRTFDPLTNRSTSGTPINIARAYHAATVVNDTIIICGGWNESTKLSSCEQYMPSTQRWSMIGAMPKKIYAFAMVTLHNHVYAFGRDCMKNLPRPVYMFDGQNWITKTALTGGSVCNHAGVALDTSRALICGGMTFKGDISDYVSDCQIYLASNDSWTTVAPMTQVRGGHSMILFKGELLTVISLETYIFNYSADQIYIFGNAVNDGTTVELYSPERGGTLLPTRILDDAWTAAVSIEN